MKVTCLDRIQESKAVKLFIAVAFALMLALPTALLTTPQRQAFAAGETVTVTVDEFTGTIPSLTEGVDFTLGSAVGSDPVNYEDENGNTPLADFVGQKEAQGFTLKWYTSDGQPFNWVTTAVNSSISVVGHWETSTHDLSFTFDDNGATPDKTIQVPHNQTLASVGGAPALPSKAGWNCSGWINVETGEMLDVNAPVTTSGAYMPDYSIADVEIAEITDPWEDLPETVEGRCYIGKTWSVHPAKFNVSGFTGFLKGATMKGKCLDRSAAQPSYTWADYEATLVDVDEEAGKVTYEVTVTPPGVTNGHSRNKYGLIGYQRVTGKVTLKKNFGGYIEIQKESGNTAISDNNDCYSLKDAVFVIYNSKGDAVDQLTTDEKGYAKSKLLPAGKYTVKETAAPQGYGLPEDPWTVTVKSGKTSKPEIKDYPQNDPGVLVVGKFDGEYTYNWESDNLPQGSASFENAEFTVTYYDGYYESPDQAGYSSASDAGDYTRQWVFKTDSDGWVDLSAASNHLVSGDDLYYDSGGIPTFPLGTYVIQETKAPVGYNINEEVFITQVTSEGTFESVETYNTPTVAEKVKRGDIEFIKTDENNQNRLANTAFLIKSNTTGESHVVVTDENGYFSSHSDYNAHSNGTNSNDAALTNNGSEEEPNYQVDSSKLNNTTGIYFGMNANGEAVPQVNDEYGAFPYDTYTLQELPCEANEGLQLISTQFSVSRDNFTIDLGTIDDPTVYIHTVASDAIDGDKYVVADENSTIRDTIAYQGMVKDKTGTMNTTYVDLETEEVIGSASTEFVSEGNGTVTVETTIDTSEIAGHKVGVKESLVIDGREEATHNEDLDEADQTVEVIAEGISTQASDSCDGDQIVIAETNATVNDRIDHTGHIAGKAYTAYGIVMDYETNLPMIAGPDADKVDTANLEALWTELQAAFGLDGDMRVNLEEAQAALDKYPELKDHLIMNSAEFTPENYSGSASMGFTFDATGLGGKKGVCFQIDVRDGKVVAQETDIESTTECFDLVAPSIHTYASDGTDGDQQVITSTTSKLVDVVEFEGLHQGEEYETVLIWMDKETEEPVLVNDQELTTSLRFTPNESNGQVEVSMEADTSTLEGKELVAFEYVYKDGEKVAEHTDINSESQTISIVAPPDESTPEGSTFDKTGSTTQLILMLIAALAAIAAVGGSYALYRNKIAGESNSKEE